MNNRFVVGGENNSNSAATVVEKLLPVGTVFTISGCEVLNSSSQIECFEKPAADDSPPRSSSMLASSSQTKQPADHETQPNRQVMPDDDDECSSMNDKVVRNDHKVGNDQNVASIVQRELEKFFKNWDHHRPGPPGGVVTFIGSGASSNAGAQLNAEDGRDFVDEADDPAGFNAKISGIEEVSGVQELEERLMDVSGIKIIFGLFFYMIIAARRAPY